MIATRLHRLIDLIGDEAQLFQGLQHYVIDHSLVAMMERTDVKESILAMVEAGVARLPYPSVLIEYALIAETRRFVRLDERDGLIEARVAGIYRDAMASITECTLRVRVADGRIHVTSPPQDRNGYGQAAAGIATAMALLLLNTRGVQKDVIETSRVNKNRIASGKTSIPQHTVLRVGTIYDREGREVRGEGERRSPVVHLRAGHARNQAKGPGWSEREVIYIPPVLVNYQPGGAEPAPRVRVVAR